MPRASRNSRYRPKSRPYAASVFAARPRSMPRCRRYRSTSTGRASPVTALPSRGERQGGRDEDAVAHAPRADRVQHLVDRDPAELHVGLLVAALEVVRNRLEAAREVDAQKLVAPARRGEELEQGAPLAGREVGLLLEFALGRLQRVLTL